MSGGHFASLFKEGQARVGGVERAPSLGGAGDAGTVISAFPVLLGGGGAAINILRNQTNAINVADDTSL